MTDSSNRVGHIDGGGGTATHLRRCSICGLCLEQDLSFSYAAQRWVFRMSMSGLHVSDVAAS